MELWTARLLKYPHWKLDRSTEYTGTLTNEYFRFLDALHYEQPAFHVLSLPEPQSSIGKDSIAHIKALLAFTGPREDRLKFELAGLKELHRKYPHAGFEKGFNEKRFVRA
jgi:hypothetical protein